MLCEIFYFFILFILIVVIWIFVLIGFKNIVLIFFKWIDWVELLNVFLMINIFLCLILL